MKQVVLQVSSSIYLLSKQSVEDLVRPLVDFLLTRHRTPLIVFSSFSSEMANLVIIALLATTVAGMPPLKQGNLECDCAARICVPIYQFKCEDGFIGKDDCKCCDICIKKEEMSKCGGIDNMGGACNKGMICRIRHPNSGENIHLPVEAKYGRCEKGMSPARAVSKFGYASDYMQVMQIIICIIRVVNTNRPKRDVCCSSKRSCQ